MDRRRVLVATCDDKPVCGLFSQPPLDEWEPVAADSFERAQFVAQHNPCEILLIGEDLFHREGEAGLTWLARQHHVPTILLAGCTARTLELAYRHGVHICLPRDLTMRCPEVLGAALQRAALFGEERLHGRHTADQLIQCRRHVDRLVNVLWRTAPAVDRNDHWYTQRHMLSRLQEELARKERHGIPLTVAVGEVDAEDDHVLPEVVSVPDWTAATITRSKRRCDVVGQYGLSGFLLLMVHTPKTGGMTCCRRLQRMLETPADPKIGPAGPVRAYFGLASTPSGTATPQSLLRCAEQNLELARSSGDDRVVAE
jgi:diguanylate cyclase (GGDEF)-like protein